MSVPCTRICPIVEIVFERWEQICNESKSYPFFHFLVHQTVEQAHHSVEKRRSVDVVKALGPDRRGFLCPTNLLLVNCITFLSTLILLI